VFKIINALRIVLIAPPPPTGCPGSNCEDCLKDIHHTPSPQKNYNCSAILNYYVPKFYYKYASEIEYACDICPTISALNLLNVVSFGCGAFPDLVGLATFLNKNNLNHQVNYTGIEINTFWQPVQKYVEQVVSQNIQLNNLQLFNVDALSYVKNLINDVNVLIFQYLISTLLKYHDISVVQTFLNDVMANIVQYMPSKACIIFNDTNHYQQGRDLFENFGLTLQSQGWNMLKYHFNNASNKYYTYGTKHNTNRVTSSIDPAIIGFCNPHNECSSAQIIIYR